MATSHSNHSAEEAIPFIIAYDLDHGLTEEQIAAIAATLFELENKTQLLVESNWWRSGLERNLIRL